MLGEHDAYHHSIKGDEAQRRLEECGEDCYLTRYSKVNKSYVLTVCKQQFPKNVIEHFKINIERSGKCKIEGREKYFDNIEELLSYYRRYRIDPTIDKIGKPYTEKEFKEKREKRGKVEGKLQEKQMQEEMKKLEEKPEEMKKLEEKLWEMEKMKEKLEEMKKLEEENMHLEEIKRVREVMKVIGHIIYVFAKVLSASQILEKLWKNIYIFCENCTP